MTDKDRVFAGSIPEIYDAALVPLIFEAYAADMARRVAALEPGAVLEIAAGSGAVPRALAPLLGPDARYMVTDLNPAMLDRARARQPEDPRIEFRPADAMGLPFGDDLFDVVACQFGAMFFPDRPAAYREVRRVLKPGGTFLLSVWDRIGENVFADVVTAAVGELFPDDPPLFLARTPHGYGDRDRIAADLRAAGFGSVEIETRAETSEATQARDVARAYCEGTPLSAEIETRGPGRLGEATDHAARRLAERFGPGPISGKIQAQVATARP
ncbi:class I SAM-dependent methyltransferase [Prosthecomicrobium sp. N25]|uniref:class I SAM-dependent methyltransferase n=1 Tax=Prosthecomicrobium sp. N25 TaxID=3129254 RepID=UPI003077BDEA